MSGTLYRTNSDRHLARVPTNAFKFDMHFPKGQSGDRYDLEVLRARICPDVSLTNSDGAPDLGPKDAIMKVTLVEGGLTITVYSKSNIEGNLPSRKRGW